MVIFGGPLFLVKSFDYIFNFITGWTIIGPYVVGLIPRIVMLLLSFISDYAVYQISILYKASFNQSLTTLASSYVMLIYSTRSFSNSVEMVCSNLICTVWKFQNFLSFRFFYVKLILQNIVKCRFCHFWYSEYFSFGKFQPSKCAKNHRNQN